MAPEALPGGYRRWITQASRVPPAILPVNLSAQRTRTFDPIIARKVLENKNGFTANNASLVEIYAQAGEKVSLRGTQSRDVADHSRCCRQGDFGPPFAPCELVHPWIDNCRWVPFDRWQEVFR